MMINHLQTQMISAQGPFSGTFRITSPSFGESRSGYPFVRLRLEDYSGHIYAYSKNENVLRSSELGNYSLSYIEGNVVHQKEQAVVEIRAVAPASFVFQDVVRLMPQSLCPCPELLFDLQAALRIITIPALKQFITQVLGNDGIAFPFISCPASLNHHHNYPGGLLKHSLESFAIIEPQRNFSRESYELGLVATLFHDIGKIQTLTPQMTRTSLGTREGHDKLTFEVLGPAFQQLIYCWAEGAKELRYLLRWKAKSAVPHYNMADLVACSDRISAGLDMKNRSF
jgi:3'-5' exoribonuclease